MGLKIKAHFTFYIFLFFVVYFCNYLTFFCYFLALFIHEISHYLLSKSNNKLTETILIYPYGLVINVNNIIATKIKKFWIFFIGPLVNILLALICITIWWFVPSLYYYLHDFVVVNLMLGFFNLIPIQPLDGGNIFLLFFDNVNTKIKVTKVMKKFSFVFSILFLILFIVSIFFGVNFSCLCMSFFLFSASISPAITYDDIACQIENKVVRECKIYAVKNGTNLSKLVKYFDSNKYVQFYFLNDKNKVVKIVSQDDISKLI